MNLAKNGAVLLAALTTFAITSCGGGAKVTTLTKEEAREFLKDAAKLDDIKAKYKVKNEEITWNCTVTGTGMTPGEEGYGIFGPVQFMIGYLADQKFMDNPTQIENWLKNFEKLKDNYTSTKHATDSPGHGSTVSYLDQEGFDAVVDHWGETDTYEFTTSKNLLHIKFDRVEVLPGGSEISFIQEIVVAKDGWVKYYTATLDNLAVNITYSMPGADKPLIKAEGTANGTVKCVTNVEEI